MVGGELEIIFVGIVAIIAGFVLVALLLKKLFPKNSISKRLEKIAEWIWDAFMGWW